jgi:hypothetical protein
LKIAMLICVLSAKVPDDVAVTEVECDMKHTKA